MRDIVNLHDPKQFEIFSYPGGEFQVRFKGNNAGLPNFRGPEAILARITNAEDIVKLNLACDAAKVSRVILPYLPYARADRPFVPGDCNGKETFLGMIKAPYIETLDMHSNQGSRIIRDVSPIPLILEVLFSLPRNTQILFPDEGARTRYSKILPVPHAIFNAKKKRNAETGKFEGFEVPDMPGGPTVIIDDICDGGGTFIGIAKEIYKQHLYPGPLYLYTTHGIYSNDAIAKLKEYFSAIWCANTFRETYPNDIRVLDGVRLLTQ